MFDAVLDGLWLVVAWPAMGYMFLGLAIGMYFGAVPGLGGLIGLAILLPFTFDMAPSVALAFLLGMYSITTTSDTIASVLLGIPGTAASQATILDGYPMAMKGEAARAFGAAFTVSAFGGVVGAILLGLSIPIVRPLILSFASPEFFMLGLVGLTMVGALSGNSILKGLSAACFGLMLSTVGYSQEGATPRYWFDLNYLIDGVPLIPFVLGLFAVPELLALSVSDSSISQVEQDDSKGGILLGMRDAATHWWLALRCTFIGAYIGLLPGLGGSIVDWVAYGHAVQTEKDKSQFGKGDVRGVIAPEAANNASKGGALIPTIAFAVPGSASMAILLVAFQIHGMEPGPQMLTTKLDQTFGLVWTLVLANIFGAALLLIWGKQVAKVTFIKGHLIVPAITMFVFMGGWMGAKGIGDWITLLVFGGLGFIMKQGGWPRPPIVLGFILGSIMENALHLSNRSYGFEWLTRPIVLILAAIIVFTMIVAIRGAFRKNLIPEGVATDDSEAQDPAVSLPFGLCFLAIFVYAGFHALGWRPDVRDFPFAVTVPAALFTLAMVWQDIGKLRRAGAGGAVEGAVDRNRLRRGFYFFLWLVGIVVATLLVGQIPALIGFIGLYLRYWGKFSWRLAVPYAAIAGVFLYVMFEWVVPILWHQSLLFG